MRHARNIRIAVMHDHSDQGVDKSNQDFYVSDGDTVAATCARYVMHVMPAEAKLGVNSPSCSSLGRIHRASRLDTHAFFYFSR